MARAFGVYLLLLGVLCVVTVRAKPAEDAGEVDANDERFKFAKGLHKCSSHDSECMRKLFNDLIPRLKDGNEALKIPPFDPFSLNTTTFQYENGAVKGRVTIKNTKVYGMSKLKEKTLNIDFGKDKSSGNAVLEVDRVEIKGNYKAEGTFNNVQFKPKGTFRVILKKVVIDVSMKSEHYKKDDGRTYVRFTDYDVNLKVGDFNFNATGIFPDPELNQVVNNVVNQYWERILAIMIPETRRYWGPLFLSISNEVGGLIPIDAFINTEDR